MCVSDVASHETVASKTGYSRTTVLVRLLQGVLLGILGTGLLISNVSVIVNAALSLLVTAIPAVLERDYAVQLDPAIVVWITLAVVLHSAGMVGLYDAVWWWDHLTHTFSGALVAAVGYAVASSLDQYADSVVLPPTFLWLFVFLVTVATGVVWETAEMAGREVARAGGFEPLLIVYGIDDTILDLVFDVVGAAVVALLARHGGGRAVLQNFAASLDRWSVER
jgi:hypothetical protein